MGFPLEEITNNFNTLSGREWLKVIGCSLSWIPLYYFVARPTEKLAIKVRKYYCEDQFNSKYFKTTNPLEE